MDNIEVYLFEIERLERKKKRTNREDVRKRCDYHIRRLNGVLDRVRLLLTVDMTKLLAA